MNSGDRPTPRSYTSLPRSAVEAEDTRCPRVEEGPTALHDDVEHALHVEGGADGRGHLDERAILRVEGLELARAEEQALEGAIRHRDAHATRRRGVSMISRTLRASASVDTGFWRKVMPGPRMPWSTTARSG